MPRYHLICRFCAPWHETDLVRTQEHGMAAHGITADQLRRARRRDLYPPLNRPDLLTVYEWDLPMDYPCPPDQSPTWLRAERPKEETPHAPIP